MSESLRIPVCSNCSHAVWPAKLLCPKCHAQNWELRDAGAGVLEEVTSLEGDEGTIWLGSVRLELGPAIVVRCDGVASSERVRLQIGNGAVQARKEKET